MFLDVAQALDDLRACGILRLCPILRMKQPRAVHLVQLARNECQPGLQAIAVACPGKRSEASFRFEIGKILNDGYAFGDQRPVIELKDGHIAIRIDTAEVITARCNVRPVHDVDAFQVQGDAHLARDDVGRKRASARGVIELHYQLLFDCRDGGFGAKM